MSATRKRFFNSTPCSKYLREQLAKTLRIYKQNNVATPRILNIGAGRKYFVENYLTYDARCDYICDRIDVDDCAVTHPSVENCWRCSVELMSPVDSNKYHAAFANYVLEHVSDLHKAAREIYRVFKPAGIFVVTVPNTTALEILLAKHTPLWFHKMIKGGAAWETHYAYNNIRELIEIFELTGFHIVEIKYQPYVEHYLSLFPPLNLLGRLYDKTISYFKINRLMSGACLVFKKTSLNLSPLA